jgi:serine/threonine protein kinase
MGFYCNAPIRSRCGLPVSPGVRIGSFEVIAPIGAGGMGEVHKATDINLKRAVGINRASVSPTRMSHHGESWLLPPWRHGMT